MLFLLTYLLSKVLSYQENRILKNGDDEFCTIHTRFLKLSIYENQIHCHNQPSLRIYTYDIENSIAIGREHMCYLNETVSVECIGENSRNQLDIPEDKIKATTTAISAGHYHTCAVSNRMKDLYCWGADDQGQLTVPEEFKDSKTNIEYLKAGQNTTCAKLKDSFIRCWGANPHNFYTAVGISPQPSDFSGKGQLIIEYGSDDTMCAIRVFGDLSTFLNCWGKCTGDMCKIPAEMVDHRDNGSVSVGFDHVCSIRNPQDMAKIDPYFQTITGCWGGDEYGQSQVPDTFQGNVQGLYAGKYVTCAMNYNYFYDCFGKDVTIPNKIKYFGHGISSGGRHTCATLGGTLECFGNNEFQQTEVPAQLKIFTEYAQAGWDYSCSVTVHLSVVCWGLNLLGQTDLPPVFEELKQVIRVKKLAVGKSHSCIVYSLMGDFQVRKLTCWGGSNVYNQLDLANEDIGNVQKVTTGDKHTCIWSENLGHPDPSQLSRIICIGENTSGQTDVPVDLTKSLTSQKFSNKFYIKVYSISAGDKHTCSEYGHRYSFSLVCWGSDSQGQSTVPWESRVNHTSWQERSLSAGSGHTCLIDFDNTRMLSMLVCWGVMAYGRGGDIQLSLVQPHLVSAGYYHDCVIDIDGSVHCVGNNDYGECDVPYQSKEEELIPSK